MPDYKLIPLPAGVVLPHSKFCSMKFNATSAAVIAVSWSSDVFQEFLEYNLDFGKKVVKSLAKTSTLAIHGEDALQLLARNDPATQSALRDIAADPSENEVKQLLISYYLKQCRKNGLMLSSGGGLFCVSGIL